MPKHLNYKITDYRNGAPEIVAPYKREVSEFDT